jgi:hypothetical protein
MANEQIPVRREAPDYDWYDDGGQNRSGGLYILKPEVVAQVKKLAWPGETIFRPFPCVSFSNPKTDFEPYRIVTPDGRSRFSDWIRRYPCAWSIGQPGITYIIRKPKGVLRYDPWSSPLGVLYKAINNAVNSGQAKDPLWAPLLRGADGRSAQLTPPKELFLMQGVCLRYGDTEYGGKNRPLGWDKNPTLVMVLSGGAGRALVDELNLLNETYEGPATDFESRYVNGDPVGVDHGRYIHTWKKGTTPASRSRLSSQPTQQVISSFDDGMSSYAEDSSDRSKTEFGFDIELSTSLAGRPAAFSPTGQEQVRAHWKHWDDVLQFYDETEQAHMLCEVIPPSAIIYAFEREHPTWISETCRTKWRQAKSSSARVNVTPAYEAPPPFEEEDDGFGPAPASVQVREPSKQQPAATSSKIDFLRLLSDRKSVEDSSVPSALDIVDAEVTVINPTVEPVAPPAPANVKESPEAMIARLAAARAKLK